MYVRNYKQVYNETKVWPICYDNNVVMIIIGVVSDILPFPLSSKMEPLERDEHKSKFSFSWKHLLISSCLWIAFLLCSMAYSTMNPFFPQEVITVIYLPVAVSYYQENVAGCRQRNSIFSHGPHNRHCSIDCGHYISNIWIHSKFYVKSLWINSCI